MSAARMILISLSAAGLFTGCVSKTDTEQPRRTDVNRLLGVFNADLGVEGVAVERGELHDIFESDPVLLDAVQNDLADGLDDLLVGMIDLTEEDFGNERTE